MVTTEFPSAAHHVTHNVPTEGFVRISQLLAFGSRAGSTPILPITRPTLYTWIRTGKIPKPMKIGGMVCWPAPQLRAWLQELAAQGEVL
jgi:predicted DNA-binding transcriptional regulator AlpA